MNENIMKGIEKRLNEYFGENVEQLFVWATNENDQEDKVLLISTRKLKTASWTFK
jgi:hypothetical protein